MLLSPTLKCWDYRHVLARPIYAVLGNKVRALCVQGTFLGHEMSSS